jgi:hypothetical protein
LEIAHRRLASTGVVSVSISIALGVPIGLAAGFLGGVVDALISRLTDAFLACPFLILAIALAAFLGPDLTNAMIAIGISATPVFVRLTRAQVIDVKVLEYIEAARALGNPPLRIAWRHFVSVEAATTADTATPVNCEKASPETASSARCCGSASFPRLPAQGHTHSATIPVAAVKSKTLKTAFSSGLRASAYATTCPAKLPRISQGAWTSPQLARTAASPQPMDSRSPRCQKGSLSSSLNTTSSATTPRRQAEGVAPRFHNAISKTRAPTATVIPTHAKVRRLASKLTVLLTGR